MLMSLLDALRRHRPPTVKLSNDQTIYRQSTINLLLGPSYSQPITRERCNSM